MGWNVTSWNAESTSLNIHWTKLRTKINREARFYLILTKNVEGVLLSIETVPGTTTTLDIKGLTPATKYRIHVYGIDDTGQSYKSLESLTSTRKGMLQRPHYS